MDGLYIDGGGHQLAPLGIFTANLLQKQIHEDLLHCLGHIGFISSKLHHCQHYCSDHCLHLLAYCRSRREWSVVGRGEGGDSQAMHVQNTSRANWLLMWHPPLINVTVIVNALGFYQHPGDYAQHCRTCDVEIAEKSEWSMRQISLGCIQLDKFSKSRQGFTSSSVSAPPYSIIIVVMSIGMVRKHLESFLKMLPVGWKL